MKRILISCPGTSDPVRGEHDGPMLHILRRYRPELALQILSPEMRGNEQRDGRFEKTRAWIAAHWEGDCPAFRYLDLSGTEVHDMDALERPLREAMAALSGEFPEAEILVNVTSGTPQMQIVLSQLAIDTRYRARAVQVLNFERRSGTSMRTNTRDYDTELELECNEDEQPDAPNRCVEPQLYALARAHTRTQILQLLESRDFEALETLQDRLPEELSALALHLAARSRLDGQEARRRASQVKGLPFQLYPYRPGNRAACEAVVEYYLLMKNRVHTKNCTEFVLHLEPLTLTLQRALLDRLLRRTRQDSSKFLRPVRGRVLFSPDQLLKACPALYRHYAQKAQDEGWEVLDKAREPSTYLLDILLGFFPEAPELPRRLFDHYRLLKPLRNDLAHGLRAVTEADIRDACGADAAELLSEIEATIAHCYSVCDPRIFSVYEQSIDYIRSKL